MSWNRPGYEPRSVRIVNAALGVLNLLLAGMILYLRFGAFERMVRGIEARGTEIPAWLELGFTAVVLALGAFLGLRGLRLLRGALRPGS